MYSGRERDSYTPPPMRRVLPFALAVCCLLAGCGAFGGSPDPGTTGRTDVTPAPVERYPPGVTEETVTNASALVAAHEQQLANESVTILTNVTTRYANGSVREDTTNRLELAAGHVSLLGETTSSYGANLSITGVVWTNESVGYSRIESDDGVRYSRLRPRETQMRNRLTPALPLFADQFTPENVTVERTTDGMLRITTAELVPVDRGFTNASLSLLVTDEGLVREYRYAVTRPCGTGQERRTTCRQVKAVRFTAVGETTVERPEWVANASGNVTTPA
jgi:hypothetical protein